MWNMNIRVRFDGLTIMKSMAGVVLVTPVRRDQTGVTKTTSVSDVEYAW